MEDLYLNNKAYCESCSARNKCKWHCNILGTNCMSVCHCPINRFDNDADWFPVLLPFSSKEYGKTKYYVPFSMIKEHEAQCLENHRQIPERLKERGGLSWDEMWAVVHDIPWDKGFKSIDDARVPMIQFVEIWKPAGMSEYNEKEFIVPVEWSMSGFVRIKAASPEKAAQIVQANNDDVSIPIMSGVEYIDGSFNVSGYDDMEDCAGMIAAYTHDYENGKKFTTLN